MADQNPQPNIQDDGFEEVEPNSDSSMKLNYDPTETTPEEWANVSPLRTGIEALQHTPPSLARAALSVPKLAYGLVTDPSVGQGIDATATGLRSKFQTAIGYPNKDIQKYEPLADQITQPFTSWGGFKKAMGEDPIPMVTMASPLLKGAGVADAMSGFGSASKLGKVGKLAMAGAAAAVNPVDAAFVATKGAKDFAGNLFNGMASHASGISHQSFDTVHKAWSLPDANGAMARSEISDVMNGKVTDADLAARFQRAAKYAADREGNNWANKLKGTLGVNTPVDFNDVINKVHDLRNQYGTIGATGGISKDVGDALDAADTEILNAMSMPGKTDLEKFNVLKKRLNEKADAYPPGSSQREAVQGAWSTARDSLFKANSEYATAMTNWQDILRDTNDAKKGLSLGDKTASGATINGIVRNQTKPFQAEQLKRIYAIDPGLEYSVAGADIRNAASKTPPLRNAVMQAILTGGAGYAFAKESPWLAGAAGAAAIGNRAISRPYVPYTFNRASGTFSKVGSGPAKAVGMVSRAAVPVTSNLERAQGVNDGFTDVTDDNLDGDGSLPARAAGGRLAFKAGGSVGANAISSEVNKARLMLRRKTERMLSLPDDAVATALHMAKGTRALQ